MNSLFGDRLKQVIDFQFNGIVKNLANKANLPYTTLNEFVLNRKDNPKLKMMERILKVSNVNPLWFTYGIGTMRGDAESNTQQMAIDGRAKNISCRKGSFDTLNFRKVLEELSDYKQYVLPDVSEVDFMQQINTSNLQPEYNPGDFVLIRYMPANKIWRYGKVYVLQLDNDLLIGRVMPGPDGHILLADNRADFPAMKIPESGIIGVGLVTGVLGAR
jgi:hypothetical protein